MNAILQHIRGVILAVFSFVFVVPPDEFPPKTQVSRWRIRLADGVCAIRIQNSQSTDPQTQPHKRKIKNKQMSTNTTVTKRPVELEKLVINHAALESILGCLEKDPQLAKELTTEGESFVHFAAKYRCAPKVIIYLLECYPDAACILDSSGKTPLHYACETFPPIPALREARAGRDLLQVVDALSNETNVNFEDNSGMCALEYAIMASAPVQVIKVLQQTSRRSWRILSTGLKFELLAAKPY